MYAVAEAYETDVRHISVGQKAALISKYGRFVGELKDQFEQTGLQISKLGTANNNPNAAAGVRVVEVEIWLNSEDSQRVEYLNKLQVRVSIQNNYGVFRKDLF